MKQIFRKGPNKVLSQINSKQIPLQIAFAPLCNCCCCCCDCQAEYCKIKSEVPQLFLEKRKK